MALWLAVLHQLQELLLLGHRLLDSAQKLLKLGLVVIDLGLLPLQDQLVGVGGHRGLLGGRFADRLKRLDLVHHVVEP